MAAWNHPVSVGPALGLKHRRELADVVEEGERRETFDLGPGQSSAQSRLGTPPEHGLSEKFDKDESHICAVVSEVVDFTAAAIRLSPSLNAAYSLTARMPCHNQIPLEAKANMSRDLSTAKRHAARVRIFSEVRSR
jgi:hypothetical protein